MSDQYAYVDEFGNPVDPSELGEGYEIVDEVAEQSPPVPPAPPAPPVAQAPAGDGGGSSMGAKIVIVGGLIVGAAVVTGLAFGLQALGSRDTVEEVVATVEEKRDEVVEEVVPEVNSCDPGQLAAAMWQEDADKRLMQLRVDSVAPLPPRFTQKVDEMGPDAYVEILQLSRSQWRAYVETPPEEKPRRGAPVPPPWWTATVDTSGDNIIVTGEAAGEGGDVAVAGACELTAGGLFTVVGDVPEMAQGLKEGQAQIDLLQGDGAAENGDEVIALMGGSIVRLVLEYTPSDQTPE